MIQELQTGILDINNRYGIDFTCKQLDDVILKIIVYDKSLPADLSNYNCRLKAFKADQVPLIQNTNITIVNNVAEIKASKQLTTTLGIVKAELQFINKSTLEKKSTFYINIEVVASVLDVDGTVSTPTCTILEEIDHKLDQIENIGEVLDEAKEVRDTLTNTTIPGATSINSTLESNIKNASNKIVEVESSITNASKKIEEVEASTKNANSSKEELDLSKTNADTTKENLDTANVQAEKNIEELNKLGDVTELAKNVQTNTTDITNLKEDVENNTSQLKEKANLKDVKIFSSLSDIGLSANDMTTDFSNNVLKIIKNMGANRRISLYPYQTESNTNLYNSVKAWCGFNTDAYQLYIDTSFNGAENLPNKIKVIPNYNDGNNKIFIGFFDNQLGNCREVATTESFEIKLLNGASVYLTDSNYSPYFIRVGQLATITGNIKVSGISDDTVIMRLLKPKGHKWIRAFTNNGKPISFYLSPSGELKIRGASGVDEGDNLPLDFSYRI